MKEKFTPGQISLEKSRAKSDEELIRGGAESKINEEGDGHLEVTKKQREGAREEMEKEFNERREKTKQKEIDKILQDDSVSSEVKSALREKLERAYLNEAMDLERPFRVDDGGPPIEPSEQERKKAKALRDKARELWQGTDRLDKLAEYENDYRKKADLYLKAGDKKKAIKSLEMGLNEIVSKEQLILIKYYLEKIEELKK